MPETLDIQPHPDGVVLAVQAQPGARRCGVVGVHHGRLKVAVTQVAEKGKANDAVIETLAEGLGLKRSQVRLVSGATNPQKRFLIVGLTVSDLRQRLTARLTE
jgi:uncharacterized protein (TIGR00251 family)